jgi:O-antigen/teichoic acid export membrane protein
LNQVLKIELVSETEPVGASPRLARNLAWNIAGESMPVVAAVFAIPILVRSLGADRFGVLMLSWMIAGYFGLFDFGLGRALTKLMARELSLAHHSEAASLFWTALMTMLVFGAVAAVILAILAPWLTHSTLRIPIAMQPETLAGFYLIALGLPFLVSASALRAALTAAERFDLLNTIRTPAGILSFAAPLLMLPFTHRLGWLIATLMLNRALSWVIYLAAVLRAMRWLKSPVSFDRAAIRPLLGFGGWITISNLITPLTVYLDRFVIGITLSMTALTAYSVPMEIISKSFILPAAISGVMFPAFTRSFASRPEEVSRLFERALKLVIAILLPLCLVIVTFAPQIMSTWMGQKFALDTSRQSSTVLQILAAGAFVTGLSWIPLALLHAAHRPDLTAKLHLADFPLYAIVLWILIHRFGLAGAAFAWSGRLLAENVVLFAMARRVAARPLRGAMVNHASIAAAVCCIAAGSFISDLQLKIAFICVVLPMLTALGWRLMLDTKDRTLLVGDLRGAFRIHLRDRVVQL